MQSSYNDYMRFYIFLFLFFVINISFSQTIDYNLNLEGEGVLYSGDRSPFWLHTNKRGRLDDKSHFMSLITTTATMELDQNSYFQLGAGTFFRDGFDVNLGLDEAFFSYISPKIGVVIGKKQREDMYRGLSATNQSILWSLNASPLPGIRLFSRDPLFVNEDHGLGFMASLEEYLLDDDRYVEKARVHHKSFDIVYRSQNDFQISLGIEHFVEWAGIAPDYGKLPNSFSDYIHVFTGQAGDESVGGQEVNALGNQIGSYELNVETKVRDLDVHFIYNSIFEDGSGMKMGNFPDGRYALFIEDNRDTFWGASWLKAIMYELYYTKNQSRDRQSSVVDGSDNYFSNNLYRSGWTYNEHILGMPFILLNDSQFGIGTNIVLVHHVGITGNLFEDIPYRFLLSYRQNYGRKDSFFTVKREVFSSLIEIDLLKRDYNLKLQFGADIKSYENSNFGIGVNFSKKIF